MKNTQFFRKNTDEIGFCLFGADVISLKFDFMKDAALITENNSPKVLEHTLEPYFAKLLKFETTTEMKKSAVYREVEAEVERVLEAVVQENYASDNDKDTSNVRALAWNIERGNIFDGIVNALQNHSELKDKDLLLLTELDYGMARSGNRFVAQELAQKLKLNYAFVPCYIALQKGSGVEAFVDGENTKSIHGLAMLSRFPMKNCHSVPLPNGKDKMFGNEKRLGYLQALVADIEHPLGNFRAVTIHLDAHSSRDHRRIQMKVLLDHLAALPTQLPTIIGGDWNTTTYNSQTANRAILGYFRRVAMGVRNIVKNHYPYPDRYFERGLFQELEKQGYNYQELNETGVGTLHYDMDSVEKNTNLGDWVPRWCFPFLFWAMKQVGGRCSLKLDWFTGKNISPAPDSKPKVVGKLKNEQGVPLSDHDAIILDFILK